MPYCYGCMQYTKRTDHMCGACGFDSYTYHADLHQLQPGVLLHGRYLVGRVLGEGGFGITYVGRDILLDRKVAIKEFYMKGFVNRNNTASLDVQASAGTDAELFRKNRDKFLNEARALARFDEEDGIVEIRDFFEENNTAYMVMSFLEGRTLRDCLGESGRLSAEKTIQIMWPILDSLQAVHEQNIIHRDISPDNIMVLRNGKIKLLDFGAARETSEHFSHSLSVILKPGYAPEEQYRSKGQQGPWTDVYALCATMYRCISGRVPDDALERLIDDNVKPLSEISRCPEPISRVIMKGLSVRREGRYQSVAQLQEALQRALNPSYADHFIQKNGFTEETVYAETTPKESARQSEINQRVTVKIQEASNHTLDANNASKLQTNQHINRTKTQKSKRHRNGKHIFKRMLIIGLPTVFILVAVCILVHSITSKNQFKALAKAQVGDVICFGNYEQDNNPSNGKEEIEWIVLAKEEEQLLVISKYGLDAYELKTGSVREKPDQILQWLNEAFMSEAFSVQEQALLLTADAVEKKIGSENLTTQKVFLLNTEEADQLFSDNEARKCIATEYAIANNSLKIIDGCCRWWILPSAGEYKYTPWFVGRDGAIMKGLFENEACAVRPVLWINPRESDLITENNGNKEVIEDEAVSMVSPVVTENDNTTIVDLSSAHLGDTVRFGRYEQNNNQEDGKEEIEWIVLAEEDNRLLLISSHALDNLGFDTFQLSDEDEITWASASIRSWLNNDFIASAFNKEERTFILTQKLEDAAGRKTIDRVFLLSVDEAEKYFADNTARKCLSTTYSAASEKTYDEDFLTSNEQIIEGYCIWWLRTTGPNGNNAAVVLTDGSIEFKGEPSQRLRSVRPAIWVDLEKQE